MQTCKQLYCTAKIFDSYYSKKDYKYSKKKKKTPHLPIGVRDGKVGTYVHLWLMHVDVWQKPTQYCKAVILQLKINTL